MDTLISYLTPLISIIGPILAITISVITVLNKASSYFKEKTDSIIKNVKVNLQQDYDLELIRKDIENINERIDFLQDLILKDKDN